MWLKVRTMATATSTLLVDVGPRGGLMAFARCGRDLAAQFGARVGLVPAGDLEPGVAASVLADARPV